MQCMSTLKTDGAGPAMMAVLQTTELIEMILLLLPFDALFQAQHWSRYFHTLINDSSKLLRRLFIRAAPDDKKWLLGRPQAQFNMPETYRVFPGLFENFAIDSQLQAIVSAKSEAAQQHQGPVARPVRYNPQLESLNDLWKHGLERAHTDRDELFLVRLNEYMHTNSSIKEAHKRRDASDVARTRQLFTRKMQLWRTYQGLIATPSGAANVPHPAGHWKTEGCSKSWAGMLLTQPPVRSVIFEIELTQKKVDGSYLRCCFHKHVVVPNGVRFGHLVAALSPREKYWMRTANQVDTLLFLQNVVEDVEDGRHGEQAEVSTSSRKRAAEDEQDAGTKRAKFAGDDS